jgi:hypothetical protein
MSRDVRKALSEAALRPVTEPDWSVVLRRGRMAARRRMAAVATGSAIVIAGAMAAPSWLPTLGEGRSIQQPAGLESITTDEPPDLCSPGFRPVTVFPRRDAALPEIERLSGLLQGLAGVQSIYFVDRREAYDDLTRAFEGLEGMGLPHHAFPAWLLADVNDGAAARRVVSALRSDPAVTEIDVVPPAERRLLCSFQRGDDR